MIPISDWHVVMLTFEGVQLQNELPIGDELRIDGASVIACAAEQALVPAAANFDICHRD
jgi:hypothetical protein